jgi:hypothetical protein
VEGSFSLESALCRMFRTDISPGSERHPLDETLARYGRSLASADSSRGADSVPQRRLPDLPPPIAARLFHERLHWWQLCSYPLLQWRFLLVMQQLRGHVRARGGNHHLIGGTWEFDEPGHSDNLRVACKVADEEIFWNALQPNMIVSSDRINHPQLTYQVFFFLPSPGANGGQRPCYGAALGFEGRRDIAFVAFTALALLESAAYVSQLLFEGKEPSAPESLDDHASRTYLGVWEYWRRLHGKRYRSTRELCLGFLAAVDLAAMADLPDASTAESWDIEHFFERVSIPYRFGKLAYRLQGSPPLSCHDDDWLTAVREFQTSAARRYGWPSVEEVARSQVVFLTKAMLYNCVFATAPARTEEELVESLLRQPAEQIANELDPLRPAWKLIERADADTFVIGQALLQKMTNALMLRIKQPSILPVSYAYASELARLLSLPIVLYEGEYYLDEIDQPSMAVASSEVFVGGPLVAARDAIYLMALMPLRAGEERCGFLKTLTDCHYQKLGFGCPHRPLTDDERALRRGHQLADWCHWTYLALQTRIASQETRERWLRLWSLPARSHRD